MIDVDDSTARMPAELKEARAAFAELLEAVGAEPERAEASAAAYPIAAQIEMPPVEKQLLLEEAGRARAPAAPRPARCGALLAGLKRSRELAERREVQRPQRTGPDRPGAPAPDRPLRPRRPRRLARWVARPPRGVAVGSAATAWTPPKKRLGSRQRTTS